MSAIPGAKQNTFRLTELPQLLSYMYINGNYKPSILILGPPGIGKSDIIRQIAQEIAKSNKKTLIDYKDFIIKYPDLTPVIKEREDYRLLKKEIPDTEPHNYFIFHDMRLTEIEPADLLGIPHVTQTGTRPMYSSYVPLGWAKIFSLYPGLLFLDELTNVRRDDVLAAAYKLLLDRAAGETRFHDGVIIIAAGNPPEYSAIARELPAPLINRMMVINVLPPTVDEWRDFMERVEREHKRGWYKRVYAFLKLKEIEGLASTYFLPPPSIASTLEPYPSPRSWSNAAWTLWQINEHAKQRKQQTLDPQYLVRVLSGFVGNHAASVFLEFLQILSQVDIDAILRNPRSIHTVAEDIAKKLKNVSAINVEAVIINDIASKMYGDISAGISDENFQRKYLDFLDYATRVEEHQRYEMLTLLVGNDPKRWELICSKLVPEGKDERVQRIFHALLEKLGKIPELRRPSG